MNNNIDNILKEYIDGLIKVVGNNLRQVILYGSYAKGEQAKENEVSDIDIMILVDATEEEIKQIQKNVLDYSYDLDLQYDILLSPIVENMVNYNNRVKYIPFYKNVQKEGVLLNG